MVHELLILNTFFFFIENLIKLHIGVSVSFMEMPLSFFSFFSPRYLMSTRQMGIMKKKKEKTILRRVAMLPP